MVVTTPTRLRGGFGRARERVGDGVVVDDDDGFGAHR
jgi:hypothetical protein